MPLDPDVERELRRHERELERAEERLLDELADIRVQLSELRHKHESHVNDVSGRFSTQVAERFREQQEAMEARRSELKWRWGILLGTLALVVSALAFLFDVLGGGP